MLYPTNDLTDETFIYFLNEQISYCAYVKQRELDRNRPLQAADADRRAEVWKSLIKRLTQPTKTTVVTEDWTVRDILKIIGQTYNKDAAGWIKATANKLCQDRGITPRTTGDGKKYVRYPTFVKDYVVERYRKEFGQ